MIWWQTVPTFLETLFVFFAPGLAILSAAGVRRLNLAALAAPVSFSLASVLAVLLGILGVPYNPVSYFTASALAAGGIVIWRTLHPSATKGFLAANGSIPLRAGLRPFRPLVVLVAVAVPAFIVTYRYARGFGHPDNLSQTFDNVYHLNAVRHIAETQNGSSLTLGNLTDASSGFYPAAMHDLMALVLMLGGGSVMEVVNVGTIIIGALIWPLSCIFLVTRIVGNRAVAILCAGVLSAGFSAFPYLMVAFGVLYPNHAAIAILPVALGLGIEVLGLSRNKPSSVWPPLLVFLGVGPGLAFAHPSTVVALVGFGAAPVAAALIRSWFRFQKKEVSARSVGYWSAFGIAYSLVAIFLWVKLRPSLAAAPWSPFQSNARAIGEIVASAPMGATAAWAMMVLTIIGVYVIARRLGQFWWVLGMYGIGGVLYLIVSSWTTGDFRTFWTGVWYNDSFRLAALLPVVTLPVAVMGAQWLAWRIRAVCESLIEVGKTRDGRLPKQLGPIISRLPSSTATVAMVATILMLGGATQGGTLSNVQQRLDTIFETKSDSFLLTSDETAVLNALADIVPEDELVVANPRTGGSLAYAVSDRRTLAPHIFGDRTTDEQYLLDHWAEAAYNTKVCPIIKKLNAYWALDFGDFEVVAGEEPFIGLRDLSDGGAPMMTLRKSIGEAKLYRVAACD